MFHTRGENNHEKKEGRRVSEKKVASKGRNIL